MYATIETSKLKLTGGYGLDINRKGHIIFPENDSLIFGLRRACKLSEKNERSLRNCKDDIYFTINFPLVEPRGVFVFDTFAIDRISSSNLGNPFSGEDARRFQRRLISSLYDSKFIEEDSVKGTLGCVIPKEVISCSGLSRKIMVSSPRGVFNGLVLQLTSP
ncbi:hypothetical protein JXB27_00390 [Candidatus Woesearchaeota archaeon]|nr:hypothetical protein [Candidatus Woesearchaeota archaeon]